MFNSVAGKENQHNKTKELAQLQPFYSLVRTMQALKGTRRKKSRLLLN
jgi:hypothetical protein